MKRFVTALIVMAGFLAAGGAEANLVGVDFGSNPNPTPQNWTATTAANGSALTNLQNDSGTLTSVGLSFSGTPGVYNAAPLSTTIPQYSYSLTDIANNIYSFTSGDIFTVTISGLTAGQSYSVYVFGLRGLAPYSQTISLVGTNTVTFTQAGASDELTVNDQVGSSSQNLSSYAKSITADSNGRIQVQVTGGSNGYFLAGLAIDVPVSASAPTATTNAASSVTTTGATLNGTINDNGASTTVTFNYGLTNSYGSSVTASQSPVASGTGSTSVSAPLTGLTCNTTYHFRVSATNSVNTTNGSDTTFTTSACPVPTLSITNSPQTYTGSPIAATVSCQGGGAVSNVLYGGSATVPTNAGTYAVTANCAASTNYSAVTGALAGNFVINAGSQPTTLVVAPTVPTSVTTGGSVTLSFTGGNGTGAVTYTAVALAQSPAVANGVSPRTLGLQCTINGAVLTATGGTGVCQVTATKAADANYQAQTSAPFNITVTAAPSPAPIPTLSEWAEIMMMFLMIATVGFYGWRLKQR